MDNIKIIREEATKLLDSDNSGHGMEHVERVVKLTEMIAETEKEANKNVVMAVALLHDVDDYKLFGDENAENLTNTKMILDKTTFTDEEKNKVLDSIKTIGYSKRLAGTVPYLIEAKIVSDADMLDGTGANGLLRTHQYNLDHHAPFFYRDIFPTLNMDSETYKSERGSSVVNHIFEKILRLPDLMLTEAGRKEAIIRYNFMIEFLKEYFREMEATEWLEYLEKYIRREL